MAGRSHGCTPAWCTGPLAGLRGWAGGSLRGRCCRKARVSLSTSGGVADWQWPRRELSPWPRFSRRPSWLVLSTAHTIPPTLSLPARPSHTQQSRVRRHLPRTRRPHVAAPTPCAAPARLVRATLHRSDHTCTVSALHRCRQVPISKEGHAHALRGAARSRQHAAHELYGRLALRSHPKHFSAAAAAPELVHDLHAARSAAPSTHRSQAMAAGPVRGAQRSAQHPQVSGYGGRACGRCTQRRLGSPRTRVAAPAHAPPPAAPPA
jgi:hypothetical protein